MSRERVVILLHAWDMNLFRNQLWLVILRSNRGPGEPEKDKLKELLLAEKPANMIYTHLIDEPYFIDGNAKKWEEQLNCGID